MIRNAYILGRRQFYICSNVTSHIIVCFLPLNFNYVSSLVQPHYDQTRKAKRTYKEKPIEMQKDLKSKDATGRCQQSSMRQFENECHYFSQSLNIFVPIDHFNYNKTPSPTYLILVSFLLLLLALIVVWVISFGAGFIPFVFIFGARLINRHASNPERAWPSCASYTERLGMLKMYSKVGYSIFFYIPMVLITVLSTRIVYIIYLRKIQRREAMKKKHQMENSQEQKQQKKEKKAVLQLLLIVGSFAIGYLPHTAFHFVATTSKPKTQSDLHMQWWFGQLEYITLRISECLNPIFYNLSSPKMRHETMALIMKIGGKSNTPSKTSKPVCIRTLDQNTV
ncbi:uncharacterized protein LOC143449106 [Clavelina lepadiformis]|uniref:uncharacterized protein LOC143449106 n=1 Tax=Clavelina lepadiformis TaxID=159417 RepID=UPI004042255E